MAARDEAHRKAEARAFTDQVDTLVSATLRGEPTPAASEDAVRLAAAFMLLDRLVTQYATIGPAFAAEEGAAEAQRVLFALRSGFDHPVWNYLNGMATASRPSVTKACSMTATSRLTARPLATWTRASGRTAWTTGRRTRGSTKIVWCCRTLTRRNCSHTPQARGPAGVPSAICSAIITG
jgi:hypothetical protein